jgi:hypothetical protein
VARLATQKVLEYLNAGSGVGVDKLELWEKTGIDWCPWHEASFQMSVILVGIDDLWLHAMCTLFCSAVGVGSLIGYEWPPQVTVFDA